jgi:peptidoglycan-N-acetylglucosamine deacetylase
VTAIQRPVFYDPTARRWRVLKRILLGLGTVVGTLLGAVIIGIFINPVLPELGLKSIAQLPQARHLRPAPAPRVPAALRADTRASGKADARIPQVPPRPRPATAAVPPGFERIAFFVNYDDNSTVSLKRNLANIDTLIPEWLHLADGSGRFKVDDPVKENQIATLLRASHAKLKVVPLINNAEANGWLGDRLAQVLGSATARHNLVIDLHSYVRERGYQGISIDFEAVPKASQPQLVAFMQELYQEFHSDGLLVSQSVPVDDREFDFERLAAANDYLIMMAYDEHAGDNEPGPVASQDWFTEHTRDRLAELPPGKVVIGLGNYGYDWTQGNPDAEERSFQETLKVARESSVSVNWDRDSGNPGYAYVEDDGKKHTVWFLDAVTAFNQVAAIENNAPRGFALWRLGYEDPGIWEVFAGAGRLDASIAERLKALQSGYDIDYEGQGEILHVTGTPKTGARRLTFDADSGLISDQSVISFPTGYEITRWGSGNRHQIVLSFDDGPDPAYTPRILDILAAKHAPALFFVIGTQAEKYPELLARLVADGHQIGNHTYTHPNIATVSDERLTLEVNAVQRLFESRLGRRSLLFRPPYAEDVEPETPDQVRPLLITSSLGYYTVGMGIDPSDWTSPGVDQIVTRVMADARDGLGQVVLLHDSGGNREQTVTALPLLIDALRAAGFELVSLSSLAGLTPEAVNPRLPSDELAAARLENAGFSLITWVERALWALFVLGLVLGAARFVTIAALAVRQRRRVAAIAPAPPSVAVLIPAFNERVVILSTVRAVLESDLPGFDVIVVDDGSSDGTAELITEAFDAEGRVRLLRQANTGKAAALNRGLAQTDAEVVVALDADTLFQSDTVRRLIEPFADPNVVAVAGCARVGNIVNLITRWQALEYITSQNLDRRAFAALNCITVVPGAVGAWRRSAVLAAGGFTGDTLAEDADLTLRLLRAGHRVAFQDQASAYTEAPEHIGAFVKQRFRWMYGTLQAAYKQRDVLFRRAYGTLGSVALPSVLVFQILFPLVSPIMDLLLVWTGVHAAIARWQHPLAEIDPGFMRALWYYALFTLIDAGTAIIGFVLDRKADWRLLPWLLPQRFFYRQLIYYVAIKSLMTALRGPRVGWGKLERTATVSPAREARMTVRQSAAPR